MHFPIICTFQKSILVEELGLLLILKLTKKNLNPKFSTLEQK